jgi:hypothetical protein
MKIIASNYNADCSWIPKETDDYFIYDRTGCGLPKSVYVPNIGNADYDRLTYIIDTYNSLPDVFTLTKSNLFKYISREEYDKVKHNTTYTPLLTTDHTTYLPICFYDEDGMYNEINNSWYLSEVPAKHFQSYAEFAVHFGLPNPEYLVFAPGGNYIVTKDRVLRHSLDFYRELRSILNYTQLPGEAQMIERTYHTLWK